jgi:hypothetical protein
MSGLAADDENMPVVISRVYDKLMAEIDAIDNGYAAYDAGVKPKYDVGGSIGHRCPSTAISSLPQTPHVELHAESPWSTLASRWRCKSLLGV